MHVFYSNHSLFSSIYTSQNVIMVYFILVLARLVTSFISGILIMAGGMMRMGVFGFS